MKGTIIVLISLVLSFVFACMSLAEERKLRAVLFLGVSALGWFVFSFTSVSVYFAALFLCAQLIGLSGLALSKVAGAGASASRSGAVLCAFSVAGLPPFLGFWPRFLSIFVAIQHGMFWQACVLAATALVVIFSLLKIAETPKETKKNSAISYIVFLLGAVSLLTGFIFKSILEITVNLIR
jgi:NADH:ubiquinone oxidoreductase subunit 2 (subunit N)